MKKLALFLLLAFVGAGRAEEVLQEISVRQGDTLWGIAQYYLKDPKRWPDLLKHNPNLSNDPALALPGMKLRVPVVLIKESLRAAELIHLLKDVRYRRKDASAWQPAAARLQLFNEDGLRTLESSAAHIRFPTGEVVSLNENSLVIIRPEKKRDAVQLLSGDVRASQARVITAGGVDVDPLTPNADFRTRVKPDKSELVLVYRGDVNVTAQGKTVRVRQGFGSQISPLSTPSEPVPFPDIPQVLLDTATATLDGISVKPLSTSEGFFISVEVPALKDMKPESGAPSDSSRVLRKKNLIEKYHLEVAEDAGFKKIIFSKYFPMNQRLNLRGLNLGNGTYWWRVAMVDALGMEGGFSGGQSFHIDATPPPLVVTSPAEGQEFPAGEDLINVAGRAEPGARVSVDNVATEADAQGHFSREVALHEGKNRVQVTAVDAQGNSITVERVAYLLTEGQSGRFQTVRKSQAKPAQETVSSRNNPLATVGMGLLAIGTILGVFLLIF